MLKKILNKILNNNPKDAISFKQAFDLTELPCITLYQGDRKFNFLLDTGSTDSIIDSNVLSKLEYKECDKKSNLFGMEGNKVEVSSCIINLEYKDKTYEFKYLINNMKEAFGHIKAETGVSLHGILGANFFNKFKYILDFDELIAYSKE